MILLLLTLASADCASCHPREAETLALSRHAIAAQLPVFVAPARKAATDWCLTCHQPEGPKTTGLECLSCHRVAGEPDAIRASRLLPTTATRAHKTIVDTRFAVTSCAGCHEFNTPVPESLANQPRDSNQPLQRTATEPRTAAPLRVRYSNQPLQRTASELRATDPKATCASCHDVHRAAGAHDQTTVRQAATFSARAVRDALEITIQVGATGHRFPTGDPFRRLVLTSCEDAACARTLGRHVIAKGFGLVEGVWAPTIDRTLRAGERRIVQLPRGEPGARAISWRAELFYGDPRYEARLPASEVSIELARGTVLLAE